MRLTASASQATPAGPTSPSAPTRPAAARATTLSPAVEARQGDRDWFGVDLTAGVRYRIEVETRASGLHTPNFGGIYDDFNTGRYWLTITEVT